MKFWNGPECRKFWNGSEYRSSGMVQNGKSLEGLIIKFFFNGPEIDNSWMVKNVKTIQNWSRNKNFLKFQLFKNS